MQDKIHKIVFELRNSVMADLRLSSEEDDEGQNKNNINYEPAISGNTYGLKGNELFDELTYYLLLRVFILKYIKRKGIEFRGFISNKDFHTDLKSISNEFEVLSKYTTLFSDKEFAYFFPKDETLKLIENKLNILENEASEDDFIGYFYEAYNYCHTQSTGECLNQNDENTAITNQIYTPLWLCRLLVKNAMNDVSNSTEPLDIKIIDPSCGCGNFLIAVFDELIPFYKSKGFKPEDIPAFIIENNIYGFDIEDKAVKIASVLLMIKSWSYSGNSEQIQFNLFSSAFKTDRNAAEKHLLSVKTENLQYYLAKFDEFSDATILGSLININKSELSTLKDLSIFTYDKRYDIETGKSSNYLGMLKLLTNKYHIVLSNPPFVMPYLYEKRLNDFIQKNFVEDVDFSNNLYSCFIKRAVELTVQSGNIVMLHPANLFYDKKFSEVKNYLKTGFKFRYLITLSSRAVFSQYVKLFDIIIYSYNKDKPEKKVVFRRFADINPLLLKNSLAEILNNENASLKSNSGSLITLKKALFFLNHPNFYDKILYRFFLK